MLTRSELRQILVVFLVVVIALVAWPDNATWTNGTVALIAFGALVLGCLGWIVIVERRLPRPFRRTEPREGHLAGSLVVAFVVYGMAFLLSEFLRQEWPREYVIYNGPPPAASAEFVVWDSTTVEVPINVARGFIAFLAVAFGGSVLGDGLLRAIHAWRTQRRVET
jgi:hypothetical protein